MSWTFGSPSCESRRRDTASYSYKPCCALVVDLMCHSKNGFSKARAISFASSVLPVPGSPLMSKGRDRTTAALTAAINSSVGMYRSVPRNSLAIELLSCNAQDLHGIGAAGNAAEFALGKNDVIILEHQFLTQKQAENREIHGFAPIFDVVGDRIDAAIQGHPAARDLVAGEGIDGNIRAHPRHPQRRRTGLGQSDDGFHMQVIRRVHDRSRNG